MFHPDWSDMPKLDSPFVRQVIDGRYVVTPEITPGYEWVFEDEAVIATEKLDGTNVSVLIEDGEPVAVFNRTHHIPFFNKGKSHIIDGVRKAFERGYLDLPDGQWFGELVGPKLQSNPYQLTEHIWIPFKTYACTKLRYKSWGRYPKDYQTISNWFQHDLFSLFISRFWGWGGCVPPEGVVFHDLERGRMAKLRRDMFPWYEGPQHKQATIGVPASLI